MHPQSNNLRILVVDDDTACANVLMWTVEMLGYNNVEMCTDPYKAIERAKEFRPDVILSDIGMPIMSGYDLCRELKKLPELENSTFIAQTGWDRDEHRIKSFDAGFNHHFVKPINTEELKELLNTLNRPPLSKAA